MCRTQYERVAMSSGSRTCMHACARTQRRCSRDGRLGANSADVAHKNEPLNKSRTAPAVGPPPQPSAAQTARRATVVTRLWQPGRSERRPVPVRGCILCPDGCVPSARKVGSDQSRDELKTAPQGGRRAEKREKEKIQRGGQGGSGDKGPAHNGPSPRRWEVSVRKSR